MGLFDSFFGTQATSSAPAGGAPGGQNQAPFNPSANPQAQPSQQQNNGVVPPVVPAGGSSAEVPVDPFAQAKDLWKPVVTDPNAPKKDMFTIDPKAVFEQAGKMDFRQFVSKDDLTKIAAGGEGAMEAFMNSMTKIGQASYATSAIAATEIMKAGIAKNNTSFQESLPGLFKNLAVSDSLRESNPALRHEAVAPLVKMVEDQFVTKFPNASQTEITKMAQDYMVNVGQAFNPATKVADTVGATKEVDWGNFFDLPK